MGHTLLPLPPELVVALEYLDMAELRPESSLLEEEGQQEGKSCHCPTSEKSARVGHPTIGSMSCHCTCSTTSEQGAVTNVQS